MRRHHDEIRLVPLGIAGDLLARIAKLHRRSNRYGRRINFKEAGYGVFRAALLGAYQVVDDHRDLFESSRDLDEMQQVKRGTELLRERFHKWTHGAGLNGKIHGEENRLDGHVGHLPPVSCIRWAVCAPTSLE